jgi:hypothetical protein
MALIVPDLLPPHEDVLRLRRERRQAERAIAYWERKAAEVRSRPTLTQLDPGETIDDENWAHRFVIAPDQVAEASAFLMCGSNAARLLELSDAPLKYALMFRSMPRRFLEFFTKGCGDASSSGSPVRPEGAIERDDGRRELYRTVFMPIGVNLVFGAYNSLLTEAAADLLGVWMIRSSAASSRLFAKSKPEGSPRLAASPRRSTLAAFTRSAAAA